MVIKKLYLDNFLSYTKQYVELSDTLNVIVGKNAAGKTNLVESIYFSSLGKSARGLRDKELINWNDASYGARVKILLQKKYSSHTIDIHVDHAGQKRILCDNLPVSRIGELIGILNIVFFSPDEMGLVKESPSDRRRFLDISLSQQNKLYFYSLTKYNKLLAQRNKVLKVHKNDANFMEMLELVTQSMLECHEYILLRRKEFLEELAPLAVKEHSYLTSEKEKLEILYQTEPVDFDDVKGSLQKLYKKSLEKDIKLEYTTVGIHRDDISIVANDIDIRKYGSQGQQKTTVLSIKLAELNMFHLKTGEYPILILDDVLSELDNTRRKALFERIKEVQTLITCTKFAQESLSDYRMFYISDKKIKEVKDITNG
ncbi:MAG: DNA replication/repair protein RecF [Clostridiales bacterium]|nr:DNA replication/repair protein RecF [Clostridiales bacterium]